MRFVRLCVLGAAGCLLVVHATLWAQDVSQMASSYSQGAFLSSPLPPPLGLQGDSRVVTRDAFSQVALCAAEAEVPPLPPVDRARPVDPQYDSRPVDTDYGDDKEGSNQLWCDTLDFCSVCCQAGLVFGLEGTFLAPMGEPRQEVTLTNLNVDRVFRGESHSGLGSGLRTWMGLQRCGSGFRVGYWHFGDETIDDEPICPREGEVTFHEAFNLKADAIDIELTHGLSWGCWKVGASFGGRWAKLERKSMVVGHGTIGNGVNLYGMAAGATEIEGPGFTFAINVRRPLGCGRGCGTESGCAADCGETNLCQPARPCGGWHLYGGFRGSALWVCPEAYAIAEANAVTADPGSAYARNEAYAVADGTTIAFVAEAQLGVQYERYLCSIAGTVFFRAGLEYQHWTTGHAYAEADSFAFLQGGPPAFGGLVEAAAAAHDGDLDLLGFVISAGLDW